MAKSGGDHDGNRVVAGQPVPRPTSRTGWLAIGQALIKEVRGKYSIPDDMHTVAVGWTSISGLRHERFPGASRAIRDFAALPTPHQYIVSPRANAQFQEHAEQDVINRFIEVIEDRRIDLSHDDETLWIFVSHRKGPCTACLQGFSDERADPGVLLQLSRKYQDLLVSLGWETLKGEIGHVSILAGEVHRL